MDRPARRRRGRSASHSVLSILLAGAIVAIAVQRKKNDISEKTKAAPATYLAASPIERYLAEKKAMTATRTARRRRSIFSMSRTYAIPFWYMKRLMPLRPCE